MKFHYFSRYGQPNPEPFTPFFSSLWNLSKIIFLSVSLIPGPKSTILIIQKFPPSLLSTSILFPFEAYFMAFEIIFMKISSIIYWLLLASCHKFLSQYSFPLLPPGCEITNSLSDYPSQIQLLKFNIFHTFES